MNRFMALFKEAYPQEDRDLYKALKMLHGYALCCKELQERYLPFGEERVIFKLSITSLAPTENIGWAKKVTDICTEASDLLIERSIFSSRAAIDQIMLCPFKDRKVDQSEMEKIFDAITDVVAKKYGKLSL